MPARIPISGKGKAMTCPMIIKKVQLNGKKAVIISIQRA